MNGHTPEKRSLPALISQQRALLIMIAIAEILAIITVSTIDQHDHIDGEVYQLGAKAWLSGRDLYDDLPMTASGLNLPFIYPPFAAIAFAPLGMVSKGMAIAAIMLITHVALLATLYVVLSASTFLIAHRDKVLLVTAAVLPLATITEPVEETIGYGQINVVLMAMVAIDCLWRVDGTRKLPYPRGLLIGLAAGLKLTPAAFLLFFLLRKDFRSILTAIAAFVGTAVLGALLTLKDAKTYWLREVLANSHISFGPKFTGDVSVYAGNQSLRSLLTKLGVPGVDYAFAVVAVIVLALAVLGMLYALRAKDLPTAVVINGVLSVLVSPISWSHHWVWAVPALVLLLGAAYQHRNWPLLMGTSLAAAFFVMGAHWKMPQGNGKELHWTFFQQLLGNSYVYWGLAFLIYSASFWWRARRADRAKTTPSTESASTAELAAEPG